MNIDGFIRIIVSLVVMWAGIGIARMLLEPLIGEAVAPEEPFVSPRFVEKYDRIVGSHDLIVHNYGPGRSMASIHAEVPNDVDIEFHTRVIDRIERDAAKKRHFPGNSYGSSRDQGQARAGSENQVGGSSGSAGSGRVHP